jgi:hypothetical protein
LLPIDTRNARLGPDSTQSRDGTTSTGPVLEAMGGAERSTLAPSARLSCQNPPKASDLSQWKQNYFSLDTNAAAKLGFVIGAVSGSVRQRVIVSEFSRSATCTADDGSTELSYGVSVRLVVHVSNYEASGSFALPYIAAEAQFGRAQAHSNLRVDGYVGGQLAQLIPPIQAFTVETYVDLMQKVSEIQQLISSDVENLRPMLLHIPEQLDTSEEEEIDSALGLVWALSNLAEGRSLDTAKREFPRPQSVTALGKIESTYANAMGSIVDGNPNLEARSWAQTRIGEIRLRKSGLFG